MASSAESPGLIVAVTVAATATRLNVSGELDAGTARILAGAAIDDTGAARFPGTPLVLDMSNLRFCDSAGLATLVTLRGIYHGSGQTLSVINLAPPVLRVIEMFGLIDFLDARADEAAHITY